MKINTPIICVAMSATTLLNLHSASIEWNDYGENSTGAPVAGIPWDAQWFNQQRFEPDDIINPITGAGHEAMDLDSYTGAANGLGVVVSGFTNNAGLIGNIQTQYTDGWGSIVPGNQNIAMHMQGGSGIGTNATTLLELDFTGTAGGGVTSLDFDMGGIGNVMNGSSLSEETVRITAYDLTGTAIALPSYLTAAATPSYTLTHNGANEAVLVASTVADDHTDPNTNLELDFGSTAISKVSIEHYGILTAGTSMSAGIGIGNISFTDAVPEPSAVLLSSIVALPLLLRRKRSA